MADKSIKALPPVPIHELQAPTLVRWLAELRERLPFKITLDETLSPAQVSANSVSAQSFTFTGVKANDTVLGIKMANGQASTTAGEVMVLQGDVSADDTVDITFENTTGGAITPTSQEYTVYLERTEA